ncbi:MAG: serine/threonine-protein kinase [Gemmatimonadota bacterium]
MSEGERDPDEGRRGYARPAQAHWAEIDALFSQALDLPPTEREALLAESTDNEDVRREVRRLLAADHAAEGFLEGPLDTRSIGTLEDALAMSDGAPPEELDRSGQELGPYRLIRRIARGGMASVYLGERSDGAWSQQVAVKVIRRGLDTEDVLARFRAERQILSSLSHPNVGRLLDGGATPDGQPYLVMEHVDGLPVTDYCDEAKIAIDERLRLFVQVGEAVAHAHRSLVIHRDIKPSNILVTAEGTAKLLDFGIAKLLDPGQWPAPEHRTRTGVRLMTPEYASPEQMTGAPVTTASDVFQLGVLLFRLLTGVSPFDDPDASPRARMPREVDALTPHPSTVLRRTSEARLQEIAAARSTTPDALTRALTGELESIVLKATDADPERRYRSAGAMIDDVQRYLSGHPVEARPAGAIYRTRKFLGRHRWVGPAAALVVLSGAGYVTTVLRHNTALEQERSRAQLEARTAQSVTDFVVGLFGATDPYEGGRAETPARELLDQGADLVLTGSWESPEVYTRLVAAVGQAYSDLDLHGEAVAFLQASLDAQVIPPSDRLSLESMLGYSLVNAGRHTDGIAVLEGTTRSRAALGDTLSNEHLRDLMMISTALFLEGEGEAALRASDRWLDRVRALEDAPDEITLSALDRIFHLAMGDLSYERAQRLAEEKLDYAHAAYPDTTPVVAHAYEDLASSMVREGRYREALEPASKAAELTSAIFGPDHLTSTYATETLASIHLELGEPSEALAIQRDVVSTRIRVLGEEHVIIPMTRHNLARALRAAGFPDEAEPHLEWAIEHTAAAYGMESRLTTVMLEEMGRLRMDQGSLDEAERLLEQVGARHAVSYDATDMRRVVWAVSMAELRDRQQRTDEARALLLESAEALRAAGMTEHALFRRVSEALDRITAR